MRVPASLLPLLLVVPVLAGCVGTRSTMIGDRTYAPIELHEVKTYVVADRLPENCERVAVLRSVGEADFSTENQMLRSLRMRAARLGANAVLLEHIRNPSRQDEVVAFVLGSPTFRKARALALRCPEPTPSGEDAAAGGRLPAIP